MSLDVYLKCEHCGSVFFEANITHNLNKIAMEAGIYEALWRPDEINLRRAKELIQPLKVGLILMTADPARFKKLNAANGWGTYEHG